MHADRASHAATAALQPWMGAQKKLNQHPRDEGRHTGKKAMMRRSWSFRMPCLG